MNDGTQREDPKRLREFLLDADSPAEELEESFFTDDELYFELQEERSALIEDYVRGHLSRRDARRFAQQQKRSASLRSEVADHRAMQAALRRRKGQLAPRQRPVRRLALVPVALACVVLAAVAIHQRRQHSKSELTVRNQAPSPASQANRGVEPSAPVLATFFLSDGRTRGFAQTPVLRLDTKASRVKLQIELRGEDKRESAWTISVLRDARQVWSADGVAPQTIGSETFLVATIPAAALPDGSYAIRLIAPGSTRPPSEGRGSPPRFFQIQRR